MIPEIKGLDEMFLARGSIAKENMIGDSGQPGPVPLVMSNDAERKPEVQTFVLGQEHKVVIDHKEYVSGETKPLQHFCHICPKASSVTREVSKEGM